MLVVLSGGTLAGGKALLDRYAGSIHHADLLPPGTRHTASGGAVPDINGPLNFLLVGSDFRSGTNPGQVWRSDTIMLVHVPADHSRAYLISIPRDLKVDIPYCIGQPDGCTDKINAAFAYGGAGPQFDPIKGYRLLSRTVAQLTGLTFDGAGVINFYGFTSIVGALGGVDMCVDVDTTSIFTNTHWAVGCYHMNKDEVLDYIRQREQYPDSDMTRQRHEQQFIKALLGQALSRGVLTDPVKLDRVIRAAGQALTIDSAYSPIDLALTLRQIRPADITMLKLPVDFATIDGISYVIATDRTPGMFAAIRDDTLDQYVLANPDLINRSPAG